MSRFLLLLLLLLVVVVVVEVDGGVFVGFGFGVVVGVAPDVAHKKQDKSNKRHSVAGAVVTATGIWTRRCNAVLPHTTGLYRNIFWVSKLLSFASMWCPYTTPARCTELACGNIAPVARSNALAILFPWKRTGASESGSFYAILCFELVLIDTISTEHIFQGMFQGNKNRKLGSKHWLYEPEKNEGMEKRHGYTK